ncbi:MAG: hypothetical protein IPJ65_21365 [Archangiaceae bacterium]|nr:hypothetical protein [Archangiaceae bacterium]
MPRLALVVVAVFGVLHLGGARDQVAVLSGHAATLGQLAAGLAYVGAWFALVLLVPPLVVANLCRPATARAAPRTR